MTDTKKIAFLVAAEGIEKAELVEPWQAVADAGHTAGAAEPGIGHRAAVRAPGQG